MPRNMSFSLTTDQVRNRTKTVTRRLGWWKNKHGKRLLQVGDIVNACVKCMGLQPVCDHMGGSPYQEVTRIEFEYVEPTDG